MSRKKDDLIQHKAALIDEATLFERVAAIIENRKYRAAAHASSLRTSPLSRIR